MKEASNQNAAQQATSKVFYPIVVNNDPTAWIFCSWLQISPDLKVIEYPIHFLHFVFKRVRAGLLYVQGQPTKELSVYKYLRSIGQIFASAGANNPCHNHMGKLEFWMGFQLASY